MKIPFFQVDAFTWLPFKGNPAAVCVLERSISAELMQQIAAENNLSETAFVLFEDDFIFIRWFTPTVEVPLCGHGTLSAAHILWEQGYVPVETPLRFQTRESGELLIRRDVGWIVMNFPADIPREVEIPDSIPDILAVIPRRAWRTRFNGLLIELDSAETVRRLAPDFGKMMATGNGEMIVTASGDSEGIDFVSRFFAPGFGIDEDPVTGSAHCSLGPFWAARLDQAEVVGEQVSRRGGIVRVRPLGERVEILGQAVTVIGGNMYL